MATRPAIVIGCDIGGVVKNHTNDEPFEGAIESVTRLSEDSSVRFIFISKCRDHYQEKTTNWLQQYNLSHIEKHYCLEYEEKVKICHDNGVNVMIDDRMQVLRNFPDTVIKIWVCSDPKKIEGARRFQPEFINSVRIAANWQEILDLIEVIKEENN